MKKSLGNFLFLVLLGFLTGLSFGGCAVVPVHEQGQLARAEMQVSPLPVAAYQDRLAGLLEPGVLGSGGAASTSCSSCK